MISTEIVRKLYIGLAVLAVDKFELSQDYGGVYKSFIYSKPGVEPPLDLSLYLTAERVNLDISNRNSNVILNRD